LNNGEEFIAGAGVPDGAGRSAENARTLKLVADLDKHADLAVTCSSDADRQRYYQQVWFTAEELVNHAATVADRIASRSGRSVR
jgi:hypothetical protein